MRGGLPLSVTVQVMVPLPLASATVLYFKPWMSACERPEVAEVTCVTPSAFHKVTKAGIEVIEKVSVCAASAAPPAL